MPKRRTKKEKLEAHHLFTISYQPPVKRQLKNEFKGQKSKINLKENANNLAKDASFEPIRRDIIKSLILVSLILALEVVIYLAVHIKPVL